MNEIFKESEILYARLLVTICARVNQALRESHR